MAQHDYDINSSDSISGFQFRQDTNNALAAIKSSNSGAVAPVSTVAGMLWLDTSVSPNILKVRDTPNSSWLEVYTEAKMGTTIASASAITIGDYGSGEILHISGTTTITALGTARIGTRRVLIFDAVTILTHNASAIICPGASSITTSNGTVVTVICEGGMPSVWRVVDMVHPSISYTELGYLDGVTSSIQGQLNGKQGTITGAATTIDTENLAVSMALVSDANGKVATHSTITSTELGYLDGLQGNIKDTIGNFDTQGVSSVSFTLTQAMAGSLQVVTTGGAIVTLPAINTIVSGSLFIIKNAAVAPISISLNGNSSDLTSLLVSGKETICIQSDGSSYYRLIYRTSRTPRYAENAVSISYNTVYLADEDLTLIVLLSGSYMNGAGILVGDTSSPDILLAKQADDINTNTKEYSLSAVIPAGMYFKVAPYGANAFESVISYAFKHK